MCSTVIAAFRVFGRLRAREAVGQHADRRTLAHERGQELTLIQPGGTAHGVGNSRHSPVNGLTAGVMTWIQKVLASVREPPSATMEAITRTSADTWSLSFDILRFLLNLGYRVILPESNARRPDLSEPAPALPRKRPSVRECKDACVKLVAFVPYIANDAERAREPEP